MKNFDLVTGLNFLLEALYYDGFTTGNKILFDYLPTYPRKFKANMAGVIKVFEYCAKTFLYSTRNTKLTISFKLTNYTKEMVYFRVNFKIDQKLDRLNENYLKIARTAASELKVSMLIARDEITLDFGMGLTQNSVEPLGLKSEDIKKYKAVIAYSDDDGFKILTNQLKNIGIDVKPKHDFAVLKMHIEDKIYRPNLVFLYKKIIDNRVEFEQILEYKKLKGFSIIAICDNDDFLDDKIKNDVIVLRQPYTYDVLCAVLNMAYMMQTNAENMGGGSRNYVLKMLR